MSDPKRREQRRTHLDASVVPVERALLARAEALEDSEEFTRVSTGPGRELTPVRVQTPLAGAHRTVAAEFRALAEELHWW